MELASFVVFGAHFAARDSVSFIEKTNCTSHKMRSCKGRRKFTGIMYIYSWKSPFRKHILARKSIITTERIIMWV